MRKYTFPLLKKQYVYQGIWRMEKSLALTSKGVSIHWYIDTMYDDTMLRVKNRYL